MFDNLDTSLFGCTDGNRYHYSEIIENSNLVMDIYPTFLPMKERKQTKEYAVDDTLQPYIESLDNRDDPIAFWGEVRKEIIRRLEEASDPRQKAGYEVELSIISHRFRSDFRTLHSVLDLKNAETQRQVLDYLDKRLPQITLPIMKALYADYRCWLQPHHDHIKDTVDAYLASLTDDFAGAQVLKAAFRLSASMKKKHPEHLGKCKKALIDAVDRIPNRKSDWIRVIFLRDVWLDFKKDINDNRSLLGYLQDIFDYYLQYVSQGSAAQVTEIMDMMLKCGEDGQRQVKDCSGEALEALLKAPEGLYKTMALIDFEKEYSPYLSSESRERLGLAREEEVKDISKYTHPFTTSITITNDQKEEFVSSVIGGETLMEDIGRICKYIVLDEDSIEKHLAEQAEVAPVTTMIPTIALKPDRSAGTKDSHAEVVETHLRVEGHLVASWVWESFIRKYDIEEIVTCLINLLGDSSHSGYLKDALDLFKEEKYSSSARILLPEFEYLLRKWLKDKGKLTTKRSRNGIQQEKVLNNLLEDPNIREHLGEGFTLTLEVVLAEEKYFGVRHMELHSISPYSNISSETIALLVFLFLHTAVKLFEKE